MISTKDALLTLLKSIDGTMQTAKFALTSKKNPEGTEEPITYSGEFGEVELKFEDNLININCKAEGSDWKTVATTLFDLNDEEWDEKATKSTANVINEAVATYFGTEVIYAGQATKQSKDKNGKSSAMTPEIEEFLEKGKKAKKARENTQSYDDVALGNRMENIFQDIKGEVQKNIDKYEKFLPEEFFNAFITSKIIEAIKINDRQTLKKVFNAFNTFYEEGDNDVQSLIVVSVLGVNFAKDDSLLEKCQSLMDEDLLDAVVPVVQYLKSGSAKKRLEKLENPDPNMKIKRKK